MAQTCAVVNSIRVLGGVTFPEVESATGLSADGRVVVGLGISASGPRQVYRWSNEFGPAMQILFDLTTPPAGPIGVSPDGGTIVGTSQGFLPCVWTMDGGKFDLPGFVSRAGFSPFASDASNGGGVVVGKATTAARWTLADGTEELGALGGAGLSQANAVSADGSIITGTTDSGEGVQAFIWTREDGMVGLGDLPGGIFFSQANGISADGSTIVGGSWSESGFEAFIWTAETGMVGLGDLPGGDFNSNAFGVSGDGSVVVGRSDSGSSHLPTDAMIWTKADGMRKLKDVIQDDFGFDLFTRIMTSANAISDDGRIIIGDGCFGARCGTPLIIEPWIAQVPDPATFDRSNCPNLLEPVDDTDDGNDIPPDDSNDIPPDNDISDADPLPDGTTNSLCGNGMLGSAAMLITVLGFLPRAHRRRRKRTTKVRQTASPGSGDVQFRLRQHSAAAVDAAWMTPVAERNVAGSSGSEG